MHELKNIITAISGRVEMIEGLGIPDGDLTYNLGKIKEALKWAERLACKESGEASSFSTRSEKGEQEKS